MNITASHRPLAGRHALVSGASRGIGAAVARELNALGARLTLLGRDAEALAHVAAGLDDAVVATADVGDAASVEAAVSAAREAAGHAARVLHAQRRAALGPRGGQRKRQRKQQQKQRDRQQHYGKRMRNETQLAITAMKIRADEANAALAAAIKKDTADTAHEVTSVQQAAKQVHEQQMAERDRLDADHDRMMAVDPNMPMPEKDNV